MNLHQIRPSCKRPDLQPLTEAAFQALNPTTLDEVHGKILDCWWENETDKNPLGEWQAPDGTHYVIQCPEYNRQYPPPRSFTLDTPGWYAYPGACLEVYP